MRVSATLKSYLRSHTHLHISSEVSRRESTAEMIAGDTKKCRRCPSSFCLTKTLRARPGIFTTSHTAHHFGVAKKCLSGKFEKKKNPDHK